MQFLNILETGFVKRWSTDHKPQVSVLVDGQLVQQDNVNLKIYITVPVIELKDETPAYQWSLQGQGIYKGKIQQCEIILYAKLR